jgi:hypothetical protein
MPVFFSRRLRKGVIRMMEYFIEVFLAMFRGWGIPTTTR